MSEQKIELKYLISDFLNNKDIDPILRPHIEQHIYVTVRDEIIDLEIENIRNRAKREEEERDKEKRIISAKVALLELVLVAFCIGIVVNQTTEGLAFIKGQIEPVWFNTNGTIFIICVSLLLIILFMVLSYFGKIDRMFSKKENV